MFYGFIKSVILLADDWFGLADRLVDIASSGLSSSPYCAYPVCVTAKLEDMADFGSNNIVVFLTIQYYCLSLRHE